MSAATAMRLVSEDHVPKALAILNGGNALATIVAAPAGSFLGSLIGWRGAFFCVVPVAAIVLVWQMASLPPMKVARGAQSNTVFGLLRRRIVALGMAAASLFFMGQFALFTYLRPFLESAAHVDPATLSFILLAMGVSGFIGSSFIGSFLKDGLYRTLIVIPVAMAAVGAALVAFDGALMATALLLGVWGLLATSAPVGWWSWLSRTLPQDAEAGGGLMVAIIQLAITFGATVGGILFDAGGYQSTFGAGAAILVLGAALVELPAMAHLVSNMRRVFFEAGSGLRKSR